MKSSKMKAGQSPRLLLLLCLMSFVIAGLSGCVTGARVVFIDSDAALIRIGPKTEGYVYYLNAKGEWELSGNKVKIPEGFFAGPMKSRAN